MSVRAPRLSIEDIKTLSEIVVKLGEYGERFLDYCDFGITREEFSAHIDETYQHLMRMVDGGREATILLRPPGLPSNAFWEDSGDTWDYLQTLRFAAGATMISQRYNRHMTPENRRKAMTAKILYKCQTGILDDLIDKGSYSYIEAKDLYHHVLSSMTDPHFDLNAFRSKLNLMMKQEQLQLFDLMTNIAVNFNELYVNSPHGMELFYQMEVLDQRVTLGQALSMFQKEQFLDLNKVKSIAKKFYSPSDDLAWHEKLANHVSGGTRYNLIDMSFSDEPIDQATLSNFLTGWYYYDAVIVYLNNIVNVYEDLKNGIANLSLIAMREDEVLSLRTLRNYSPKLTREDYSEHIERLADLASRAVHHVTSGYEDVDKYYPFITVMMPVVMMADWIGERDDLLRMYLESIAPAVRAVSSVPLFEDQLLAVHTEET